MRKHILLGCFVAALIVGGADAATLALPDGSALLGLPDMTVGWSFRIESTPVMDDGALYATSHPNLWKFEEKDGRVHRQALVSKFNFNGNGCDIHGPFLGPDGRLRHDRPPVAKPRLPPYT